MINLSIGANISGGNKEVFRFTPYDIDALVVDTDFDRPDLVSLSGDLINSVVDATGNGNTAVKTTDAERPMLVTRNGKKAGYWDATVRALSYTGSLRSYNNANGVCHFIIAEWEVAGTITVLLDRLASGGFREFRLQKLATNDLQGTYSSDGTNITYIGNTKKLIEVGVPQAIYMNNPVQENIEIGIGGFDPVERDLVASKIYDRTPKLNTIIGRAFLSSLSGHRGWIYRILTFSRGLTDVEKNNLLQWAKANYGADVALKNQCLTASSITSQSNMKYWDKYSEGYNGDGSAAFVETSKDYFGSVFWYNGDGSVNSSAIHKDSAISEGNYWWDTDTDEPGPLYIDWRDNGGPGNDGGSGARNDLKRYTDLLSIIGETDSLAIQAGTITREQFKDAFKKVLEQAYVDTGGANIYLSLLATRAATSGTADYRAVNEAMLEIIDEVPYVYFGIERYDIPRQTGDDVHHSPTGMATAGDRFAERVAAVRGRRTQIGTLGGIVIGGTFSGTNVTVNIQHDGGDTLLGTDYNVFEILDDGNACTITGMIVNNNNLIFTLSAPIAADSIVTIRTNTGMMSTVNPDNVVRDNLGLPLRTTKEIII